MIRISHTYDDKRVVFTAEGATPGMLGRLFGGKKESGNVDDWVAGDAARCGALGALRMFGEDHPGTVLAKTSRLEAAHFAVASLDMKQARALGLPGRPPYVFTADTAGVIGSPEFTLSVRWLDAGTPIPARRRGAFLETPRGVYLIPEPLFSATELADGFDAGAVDLPGHWAALADFRRILDPEAGGADSADLSRFLQDLRIYTGAALSLALTGTPDDMDFDPVLYNAETANDAADEGRSLTEKDGMLPEEQLRIFQRHARTGFRAFSAAKRSYLLGRNTYLIVDDDLETVLQVVREKQRAGPEERRAFAANPRAVIVERLAELSRARGDGTDRAEADAGEEDAEARAAVLFIETPEYADRAIGIGLWEKPPLEFLPHVPNVWLPETFALELGGVWVHLDREAVADLRKKVDQAIEEGEAHVEHRGQRIPATAEVQKKLSDAIGTERPAGENDDGKDETAKGKQEAPGKIVVNVEQNFVEENWPADDIPQRQAFIPAEPPTKIGTTLLPHQQIALGWQIAAWRAGLPGVLNADDQGLGKTLQTLAFLAWLQGNMERGPPAKCKPVLVVAPTGLLRTWEHEEETHLTGTRLGARLRAYGPNLVNLKTSELSGRDTDDGKPRLGFEELRSSIDKGKGHNWWLLTTYETLKNYQHSFRQIDFSAVVFDEIQKIKNVQTLVSLAARGVKADFRIGLTGTPIENHVIDLWAIMDAVVPGRLGTLKEYIERYRIVTETNMPELYSRLFMKVRKDDRCYPPCAQRRFKDNEIEDLPRKHYRAYPTTMPEAQAQAYETARGHLLDGARGAALKLLHHIRAVSLHPEPPETARADMETYFVRSARFEAARRVLESIRERGERALIYTEDRRMQAFVSQWLRSEFGLSAVSIINGATSIAKRQRHVKRFQEHLEADGGFDVMVLSPRAAGVGLTLTAATHVIHLSRWWNPAVEEQCNDRVYRIGQKRDVTVHIPLAIHPGYRERTFDCVLNDLMRRKTSLARAALWPPTDNDFDFNMLMAGVGGAEPADLAEVDDLDWHGFENWIMERARESGDWRVSQTPTTGDRGADVVLKHSRRRDASALVQAKHTDNRERLIDEGAVREVMHSAGRYDVRDPQLVVITNACSFTDRARNLALENGVTLLERDRLALWPGHTLG